MEYLQEKIGLIYPFPITNGSTMMTRETLTISFEDYMEFKKIMSDDISYASSCVCQDDNCYDVNVEFSLHLEYNENEWIFDYMMYSNEQYELLKKLYKNYKPQEHHK
jgi:hypothetical protein